MSPKMTEKMVLGAFVLIVILGACWQAQARDAKNGGSQHGPLDQYLMERNAEIALAQSAAQD